MSNLVIMKFGGTSLGGAARIRMVAEIVANTKVSHKADVVVVASAMSTVTNLLVSAAANAAAKNKLGVKEDLSKIRALHIAAITDLKLPKATSAKLSAVIEERLAHLRKLLESILELGEQTTRAHDLIVSFGERMSIHLVSAALDSIGVPAVAMSATDLIVTSNNHGSAIPDLQASTALSKPKITRLIKEGKVPVVTGFIGATNEGVITTLGRGGSDYSATILGYCLDASAVEIWTDVDGVMTADPRIVPEAYTIEALSYNEAAELSYFGAKVLHPLTMVPAVKKKTPIWIKNTLNPSGTGTKISGAISPNGGGGKAISNIRRVSLVTVQGRGMLGVPGIAGKVFTAVAGSNINVLFISQASSEFNISFVVPEGDGDRAVKLLAAAFRLELMDNQIEAITTHDNLAIIAIVGEGMKGHTGNAGMIFSSLGEADINIMAIAQGSSERNISLVIADRDLPQAIQSIHDRFHVAKV